jgi:hypothetical protein
MVSGAVRFRFLYAEYIFQKMEPTGIWSLRIIKYIEKALVWLEDCS